MTAGETGVAAIADRTEHPQNIWPAIMAGILTAFVGYASSFTVVLQGLKSVGATPGQATSGLIAVGTAMGLAAIYLALRYRMPISIAWSTPGAALLASTGAVAGGFEAACGAFIASGVLIVIAGLWKPFGKLVSSIPAVLANAMLAGVLFGLCVAPFHAIAQMPSLALPVVLAWAVMARIKRLYAVPVAVVVAVIALTLHGVPSIATGGSLWPQMELVTPHFSWNAIVSIGLPLFLVTMASQNIPGLAVLRAFDYNPPASPLFVSTGIASLLSVPFGGYAVNLAAITAALCAAPEAHPDPRKRYIAAVVAGAVYVAFGVFAGMAASFISVSPPILIQAVAGLALLGAFGSALTGALGGALQNPSDREAAVITFVATASGMSIGGIGSAFWGLVAGGLVMALHRLRRKA